ncbi:hypothetical protein [Paludisphaera mucosa]|uniref:Ribbon-helix-helix protein CopG domain-containing protein n=1 Tax=Paludisphaera mucosa TaxID=3030827 RepID=A0ABT6F6Y6_9BACT|nr:hypothetical protein [Paludisphaera mucosa]MDG3003287.1 hypothetical protein [Paludisphaera mucosa]
MTGSMHRAGRSATTRRLSVDVHEDAFIRLHVHCVHSGRSPGQVVAEAIDAYCRDFPIVPGDRPREDD